MKLLYVLTLLFALAAATPAPVPSGYPPYPKRASDSVLAKRQVTVADLKRRAQGSSDQYHKPGNPSGYPPGYYPPQATDAT